MSAVWAPVPDGPDQRAASRGPSRLRAVQPPANRLSRAPFLLVLIGVFGLGMAGLLMLNTTLQNQAFSSRALDRQATELAYAQADLENQIDLVSAPPELARRASALGMRPNPYPAFLEMPSGTVVGKAQPVRGSEVPSLVVRTPAEVAAAKAAAEAKAKAAAEEKARKAAEAKAQEKAKAAAEKKAAAEQQAAADQKATKAEAKKAEVKKAEAKKSQAGRG
jgi:hypothetical protein